MSKDFITRFIKADGTFRTDDFLKETTRLGADITKAATQATLLQSAAGVFEGSLAGQKLFFLELVGQIEKFQVDALKTLGITDFNKELGQSVALFQDLNNDVNRFGITQQNVKDTIIETTKAFDQSGEVGSKGIEKLSRAIAANSNIVDRSTLVEFSKGLVFQSGRSAEQVAGLSDNLIKLAVDLRRPPSEIIKMTTALASNNATFATTSKEMDKIIIRSTKMARALGIGSDALRGYGARTFTIQSRIRELGQLGRLARRLGFDINARLIGSTKAADRIQGAIQFLYKLNRAMQNATEDQKQATAAYLETTQLGAIGGQGIRAAIMARRLLSPAEIEKLVKERAGRGARPGEIDRIRRGVVTTADRLRIQADQIKLAEGMKAISKLTGITGTTQEIVQTLGRDLQEYIPQFEKAARAISEGTGQFAGVVVEFVGLVVRLIANKGQLDSAEAQRIINKLTQILPQVQTKLGMGAGGRTTAPAVAPAPTPTTTTTSDIRLKENIKIIGASDSGIPVYNFSYINDPEGTIYQGAMAQDLLVLCPESVVIEENGYYAVDYSLIDIDFKAVSKLKNI